MPELNYSKLKKNISENKLDNLYFLQGEEYLIEYFEQMLKKQILGDRYSDFDILLLSNDNINLDKLSLALETFPVMSQKKCVIIRNLPLAAWSNEDIEKFSEIISNIPDFSCLIVSQYENLSKVKNYLKIKKTIEKSGSFANFLKSDIPIEKQFILWANKEFGKVLSPENAEYIKKACPAHNITALKNELKKICEFEQSKTITKESLEIIVSSKLKTNIFSLPKALFEKDAKKTFETLDNLINQKEEPTAILAILAGEYIDLYRAKCFLNAGKNVLDLANIYDYKGKEFRLKNAEKRCKNMSISEIKTALDYILKADIKLKTTSIDPKLIISELITKLLSKNIN